MHPIVTTPPTAEPIHLDEAKAQLVLSESFLEDDRYVESLIATARRRVERYLGRALLTQELTLDLDMGEARPPVWLPRPPFQSLTSFTVYDQNNAATTPAATKYRIVGTDPAILDQGINDVYTLHLKRRAARIIYKVGYATPFTASSSTLTATNHAYSDGDAVRLSVSGGDKAHLPPPLEEYTTYYVRDVSGNTLSLAATSGGSAITTTGSGLGNHFIGVVPEEIKQMILIEITRLYEHRGEEDKIKGLSAMSVELGAEHRYDYL